ncbi:MAG: CHAT domain-containing protein [Bacteroidia bacterium]|nr:CHAT domain-containing protein [Bacteroidia bacterium]
MKVLKLFYLLFFSILSLTLTAQETANDTVSIVYSACINMVKAGHSLEAVTRLSGLLKPNIQLTEKQKLAVNNNLGILHKNLGQYVIALKHYDTAESIYLNNRFTDNSLLVSIYGNKANIYSAKGDYNKALEYIEKAIRSIQGSNASPIFKRQATSSLYLNAGIAYSQLNELNQALSSFNNSISIYNKYSLPGKDIIYLHLAGTFAKMENKLLADKYFNLSIRASEAENKSFSVRLVEIYRDYSYFLLSINENTKALSFIHRALNLNIKNFGEKNKVTSSCYQFLGDYYRTIKDYQKALTYYQMALISGSKDFSDPKIEANPSLIDINFNLWQLRLLGRKADVLAIKADEEKDKNSKIHDLLVSLSTMNLAIEMTKTVRGDYQYEEARLIFNEKQKNVFVMALETALKLYDLTGERRYLNLAYQNAQQGKANELKYEIARNKLFSNNEIPDSLRNKEKELQGNIAGYSVLIRNESALSKPDTTKIAYWKDQQFDLNRLLEKQTEEIERNYPRYIDKIKRGNIIAIETIQSNLKPDESLIEYVISEKYEKGDRKLYEFVITQKNLVCHTELIDSTLSSDFSLLKEQLVNQFTENNGVEYYNKMNQLLYYAYNVLIQPIEKHFAGKQLIIIPDDEISYLPFDALLTSWTKKKKINYAELAYLIRDYSISYAYSTNTMWNNQSKAKNCPKVIGFAPDYSNIGSADVEKFKVLKSNNIEVGSILNNFDGTIFKADQATIANFRSNLNSGAILHLAMHAELDDKQAGSSSLIFTPGIKNPDNYRLYNYEIGQMNINSPMVVLSACNTGNGKLYSGEGLMSLARNFVLAGVPSVIETLWPVEDVSGSKIMGSFYKYLSQGKPKNTALRQAKLDYINNISPSFVNPRFWAAYTLMGDVSAIKKIWWKDPWIIISLIIVISTITVLLIYRLRLLRITRALFL